MRWRPAFLAILPALTLAPAAEAAALKVDYRITLAGLTLGQADLSGTFERDRYDLQMKAQLTGMAGLLSGSGRGGASARGSVASVRLLPSGFSATGQTSSAQRTVQVGIESGNVTRVEINPPFERRTDRVPLTDEHKAGIIDPLSATLVAVPRNNRPGDPANCERTMPVFDGTLRFDVVLSYVETKRVQKPGYSGDVLVCSVRYIPVAGHRPDLPSVRFMAANQDINVWLAPVEGTRLLAPIRISVATMLGTTVIEAERWTLDTGELKGALTR